MAQQTANSLKSKALGDLDAGKLPQALKKAQLGVKKFPKDSDYHAIAGFVLTEMKRYKQSIPHFIEAARMKPDDPQFVENLANALMQTGQIPRALTYAEQKLEQFPNNKELVRVIDEIQLKGQNWRLIIDHASQRLQSDPDNAKLLSTRARAYGKIGFVEHSSRDITRAYEIAPEDISIAFQRAVDLHQAGDKEGSAGILQDIRTQEPLHATTLLQLASIASKDQVDELFDATEQAIFESEHTNSVLEFAQAHLISKRDGLEAALPQFAIANAAQHDTNPYDFAVEEKKQRQICDMFPAAAANVSSGHVEGPVPIFVIGQPRSGTTLMEMMLSSAPDIAGCGELTLGADLSQQLVEDGNAFDTDAARAFAEEFRKLMPPIPDGSTAFVDKMPHNYQRVGFLLAAFPNAKIINMLRDPRDVGLSKWIRRFPAPGMRYASNLSSIAHSANMYRTYMAHWDQVFGDRILTVPYEDLVADPETHSRKVAEFCGITWHEQMMHPEENTKQVRTASIDQVRNKISTKSIGGWRKVADQIQPMLDGIDPQLWPEYDFS
ncbi:tetratricopeptide repeat-containing sulfotransferase family protein [Ruegeria sp.]|uniref:tetratricopeptide repeat-containing sulfotransferase family protein n=1 Tax=Ruegeria sp. TaxID=1879320 RepID=UPI00231B197B|nr:tetratricopeptide repeat-containing sulfotransferase family protein [Ruegeria sp.]MDA7964949.1 sulfotransferase [Ruegeria sp.]